MSSFLGGSVGLVKYCVEELGVWSRTVAAGGFCHDLTMMDYIHRKALERAALAGTSVHDEIDYSMFSLASMLDSGQCDELVLWVLRHTSEKNPPKRSDGFDNFKNLNKLVSRKMVSWSFMRQYMLLRPQLCRQMRLLPQWVVQFGTLSDFHALEAIQHPKFFSKQTLWFLLAHSRDDVVVRWFIKRCDSSLLGLNVVSWAARFGALEILQLTVEQRLAQGEQRIKMYGTVVWSAIANQQVSVLNWIHELTHASDLVEYIWRFSIAERAAQRGSYRSLLWLYEKDKVSRHQMDSLAGIAAQRGQMRCLEHMYNALRVQCSYADLVQAGRRGYMHVVECILRWQPALHPILLAEKGEMSGLVHHYEAFLGGIHQTRTNPTTSKCVIS